MHALALAVALSTTATVSPPPAAPPPEPNVSVEKIVFAVDVSSRVPVGAADSFDESAGEVYCWNQIAIAQPPAKLIHEWYRDDVKIGEIAIQARFRRMRIWTRRKVSAGQWRVEIKDGDTGQLLAVGAFPVRKAPRRP